MKRFSFFFVAAFLMVACSPDTPIVNPDPVEPDEAKVIFVSFPENENPGVGNYANAVIGNGYAYITVPEGVSLKALTARITVSKGAKCYLDGQPFTGTTALDFTRPVALKVESKTGKKTTNLYILVKNGEYDIDKKAYDFMIKYEIPGVSVSVMKGEEICYASGYGLANVEAQEKVTPDHLFRLASITKTFTSVCAMKLIEDGKMSLDDKVFGTGGILDTAFPGVTGLAADIRVRNLLQHNNGISTSPDLAFSGSNIDNLIKTATQSMVAAPGTKFSYSNIGFMILGKVIETVSGKDYETFLKEDVLKPMGITDIHVGGDKAHRRTNECIYYSQDGKNGYGNNLPVIKALGGLIASTNQLMTWLAHLDGLDGVPDFLKPETLKAMYTTVASTNSQRALGWSVNHSTLFPGGHFHSGNLAGTATYYMGGANYSGTVMSCAVLCNSRNYDSGFDTALVLLDNDFVQYFKK